MSTRRTGGGAGTAPSWFTQITAYFQSLGVPASIWIPIAQAESGMNPGSINPRDTNGGWSVGLFQANQYGQGSGYTEQALTNPLTNARATGPSIAKAYKAGLSHGYSGYSLLQYTVANSGHAGLLQSPGTASTLQSTYQAVLSGTYQGPNGATVAAGTGTAGSSSSSRLPSLAGGANIFVGMNTVFNPQPGTFGLGTIAMILVRGATGLVGLGIAVVGVVLLVKPGSAPLQVILGGLPHGRTTHARPEAVERGGDSGSGPAGESV